MPVLVLPISKDLHKLLEDRGLTTVASLSKLSRVVIMAVDFIVMFIVAVLRPKDSGTNRACEMLNVIFSIQGRNIRTTKRSLTLVTQKVEATEVISLTQRILTASIILVNGKEFRSHDLTTVLSLT